MQFTSIWPIIRNYHLLLLWARVDLGSMELKGYSAFPKAPAIMEPHHHIV